MLSAKSKNLRAWLIKNLKNAPPPPSIQEAREVIEAAASRAVLPEGTVVEEVMAGGVFSEWVRAANADAKKVIVHFHGGGYVKCSCKSSRLTAAQISAASECAVLVVGYRLAPEHPFPAALEDTIAAYRWLLDQGYRPEDMAFLGDSSGGGLSLAAMMTLLKEGDRLPCATLLLSPWTDLTCDGESMTARAEIDPWMTERECRACAEMYAPGMDLRNPLISPIYGDFRGLPPLLIHVGTDEILLDDSLRLAEKVKAAGVDVTLDVWEGMWHFWHCFAPNLPEGVQAINQIGEFVKSRARIKSSN